MARKRKVREEPPFKIPEFDREEFERKEIRDAKLTLTTFFYAFVIAMFTYAVGLYDVRLAVLIGFLAIYSLKYLFPLAGFNTGEMEKKTWAGMGALFLFTWLAIWILLVNPPATDFSRPEIEKIEVWEEENGTWAPHEGPVYDGDDIMVAARVLDNGEISSVTLTIEKGDNTTSVNMIYRDGWYVHQMTVEKGVYHFTIKAEDEAGNVATRTMVLDVS